MWKDANGIRQAEGGAQGCASMIAFYALAQHASVVEVDGELLPDEIVLAFLHDIHIVTSRARAREAFSQVSSVVQRREGVRTFLRQLSARLSGGGPTPEDLTTLGPSQLFGKRVCWQKRMALLF